MHRKTFIYALGLSAAVGLAACSGSDETDGGSVDSTVADAGTTDTGSPDTGTVDTGTPDTGTVDTGMPDMGMTDTGSPDAGNPANFTVTIENISGPTFLPGPLSPGAWVIHSAASPLYASGQADLGEGLIEIAEDGNPTTLVGNLPVGLSGAFATPVGGAGPAPAFPGESYEFSFDGDPANPKLSFATMLVQTNDVVVTTAEAGIDLYDANGAALDPGDVTDQLAFYETGSEANQTPGQGPDQAPRQSDANIGREPGSVGPFTSNTRAIPQPSALVDVTVTEAGGAFTVRIDNISADRGALPTPLSPVLYVTHDDSVTLFTAGQPDRGQGLEAIAEDGDASGAAATFGGLAGVGAAAVQATTVQRPNDPPGPAFPGESYEVTVTPTAQAPRLSVATMVVQSNDAFLAFQPEGIALLNAAGAARDLTTIADEVRRALAVWDAGTEANEVAGVGPNQVINQANPNTGPDDPNDAVRIYSDSANDLAGPSAGGFATISLTDLKGDIEIRVQNTSDDTAYPGVLTPLVWAMHSTNTQLFSPGAAASAGLESMAEDGDPSVLAAELVADSEVNDSGVANRPMGQGPPGPILPGQSYRFVISPAASHPQLSFASMIVPSNDTFLATAATGVALYDAQGSRRDLNDIAADLTALVGAWDAGTEANQAGAAGRDQAPRQSGPNVGAAEEALNVVSPVSADPVWTYPRPADVLRVTVRRN